MHLGSTPDCMVQWAKISCKKDRYLISSHICTNGLNSLFTFLGAFMKGMRIGYIRVSAEDQNPDRQLTNTPLDKKFIEYASGKDTNRPQFQTMLEFIREGDILIVHSLDRLARNLSDLRQIVQILVKKGVHIQFMTENLIFTGDDSPMSMLLLSMMGAFAEFERAILRERQKEGIEIAKKKGKYIGGGKKKSLTPLQVEELKARAARGETKKNIAKAFNLKPRSVYNYLSGHMKKV